MDWIANDLSEFGNQNCREDTDNLVTVPEETNESDQSGEKGGEGQSGVLCSQLKGKLTCNIFV